MRYLDPKNDLTFKKVFGEHPHLLKSFLNAMLPLSEDEQIETLEYLPPELVPEIPLFKYSIVDVRCIDKMGRQFIVEMQMCWTDGFKERVLFNASKAYVKQLGRGEYYKALQPVYALNLVNEIFEPDIEDFYHHYQIVHCQHSNKILKGLQFVFIELPKFKSHSISEKRLQVLWLRYLTEIEHGTNQIAEELLTQAETKEAIDYIQESAFNKNELAHYDKYWDSIRTEKTIRVGSLEKGIEEGIKEGIKEGRKEGRKEGIKEGRKEGLIEGEIKGRKEGLIEGEIKGRKEGIKEGKIKNTIEIINKSIKEGLSIEIISKITGLSAEEINKLTKK